MGNATTFQVSHRWNWDFLTFTVVRCLSPALRCPSHRLALILGQGCWKGMDHTSSIMFGDKRRAWVQEAFGRCKVGLLFNSSPHWCRPNNGRHCNLIWRDRMTPSGFLPVLNPKNILSSKLRGLLANLVDVSLGHSFSILHNCFVISPDHSLMASFYIFYRLWMLRAIHYSTAITSISSNSVKTRREYFDPLFTSIENPTLMYAPHPISSLV